MAPVRHVLIVGAGLAGVATVVHLARHDGRDSIGSITVVDPNRPGHGLAFGSRDAELVCNTSVDIGSLIAHDPDDFWRWLKARGRSDNRDSFAPRALVAQYAFEHYVAARRALEVSGTRISHVRQMVTRITGTPGKYLVHASDTILPATDVMICAGVTTPIVPEFLAAYTDVESVTIGPYPVENLIARIRPRAQVLVIGSRLSAIDAALVLAREGRHVTLTSRSGLLPAVRSRFGRPTLQLPTRAWLAALDPGDPRLITRLMRIGLEHLRAYGVYPLRGQLSNAHDATTRLREETRLAATGQSRWQELAFELATGLNGATWVAGLTGKARAELDRHFKEYLTRYLTAMPLVNAEKLVRYNDVGRFAVALKFPENLTLTRTGWRVDGIRPGPQVFDHIVSAAGYEPPHLSVKEQSTLPMDLQILTTRYSNAASSYSVDSCLRLRRLTHAGSERIWIVGLIVRKYIFAPNFLNAVVAMAARAAQCLMVNPEDKNCHSHSRKEREQVVAERSRVERSGTPSRTLRRSTSTSELGE